ncbi:hypothetical protein [[Clostridium] dakarense]|uniref:hypothetical protein n=1 Tax=Faecalimicrobium dakarense TaxID=1301100 RepID=UPI0004ACDC6F|nr:hypothetical protein [[Clostridium] dakarense]
MKYILFFLIILSFIGPTADSNKSLGSVFKDGFYNYITCLDNTFNYLADNVDAFSILAEIPYEKAYKDVMDNRHLTKHLVSSGETLDDIIKKYNTNIDDIENFRKVVYKENEGIVSKSYDVQSGEYIVIPSD